MLSMLNSRKMLSNYRSLRNFACQEKGMLEWHEVKVQNL